MAQATNSLSPKRALERMQRHRHAVIVLALQRAKKVVQANIRAKGQRITDFSAREITLLAEDYLAQHRQELRPNTPPLRGRDLRVGASLCPKSLNNRTLAKSKQRNRGTTRQ
jgi:hypothetical protein